MPRCLDCLSENVAVKVIDQAGFGHWFCAEDWAANRALHDKIMAMLEDATKAPGDEGAPLRPKDVTHAEHAG